MKEVSHKVKSPDFQTLDNERLHLRSAVTSSEARLDIKAGGFWSRGFTAFFDVRVTHVNSKCYQNLFFKGNFQAKCFCIIRDFEFL